MTSLPESIGDLAALEELRLAHNRPPVAAPRARAQGAPREDKRVRGTTSLQ